MTDAGSPSDTLVSVCGSARARFLDRGLSFNSPDNIVCPWLFWTPSGAVPNGPFRAILCRNGPYKCLHAGGRGSLLFLSRRRMRRVLRGRRNRPGTQPPRGPGGQSMHESIDGSPGKVTRVQLRRRTIIALVIPKQVSGALTSTATAGKGWAAGWKPAGSLPHLLRRRPCRRLRT